MKPAEYMNNVASYAILIPGAIMCLVPVRKYLRISFKKLSLFLFTGLIIYSLVMPFAEQRLTIIEPNVLFFLTIALCFIGYCMAVNLEKIKLLYLTLSTMAILSFGGLANYMAYAYVKNYGIKSPFYNIGLVLQWITTIILMCLILFPLFSKKIIWTLEYYHTKSVWNIIWIVPALVTFVNYTMIPVNNKNATVGRIFRLYILVDFSILLLFLLFQLMFYLIVKTLIEKSENEKRTQLLQMESAQYQLLLNQIEHTSKLRHDFRHTAHTILSLAKKKDTDKIILYLEEYNHELNSCSPDFFCKHSAVNAILAYYSGIAAGQSIQTDWHIELPEQIAVSDVDLCTILGNLLENAIQGCLTIDSGRFINLSADITKNGELYIIAVNSFDGSIRQSERKYLSTKKDGNGIGLTSVSLTAEKYFGVTSFSHSESEFYSEIMLNLPIPKAGT